MPYRWFDSSFKPIGLVPPLDSGEGASDQPPVLSPESSGSDALTGLPPNGPSSRRPNGAEPLELHSVRANLIPIRRPTALAELRRDDAREHRRHLKRLSESIEFAFRETRSVLSDMLDDGFHEAVAPAAVAVLRLRQAQRELEAAAEKVAP